MTQHITIVSQRMTLPQPAEDKIYPEPSPILKYLVCLVFEKLGIDELSNLCGSIEPLL